MESYVSYQQLHPSASIEDYTQEVHRVCEFDEFLAINRQAAVEESETFMWQQKNMRRKKRHSPTDAIMSDAWAEEM